MTHKLVSHDLLVFPDRNVISGDPIFTTFEGTARGRNWLQFVTTHVTIFQWIKRATALLARYSQPCLENRRIESSEMITSKNG